jgi:acetoacetate decarboxylase
MGKFTLDRFGQSGPAHSPLYEVPFQVKNATHLLFRYEADRDAVEDILPEGCDLKEGPVYVWALVQSTDELPMKYSGCYIFPECTFEGKDFVFEYFLMVDADSAMASGREFWGDSKKLAKINMVWEGNEVFTTCERPTGFSLVNTHIRVSAQISPNEAPQLPPGICMKMIPSSEEGKPLQVHQYVEDATNLVPSTDASGRMNIFKAVGSVMMPNETDVWPIYKLKPKRMLDAWLIHGDMDFGYGKILKDLTVKA